MTNKTNKSLLKNQWKPDAELLDFAERFADNYTTLECGIYVSDKDNYKIEYVSKIPDTKTGARVSNLTGVIQLDKTVYKSKEYSEDFIFYIILWCRIQFLYPTQYELSDLIALKYYLTTNRSKLNILKGYIRLFKGGTFDAIQMQKQRYEKISLMIIPKKENAKNKHNTKK